MTIDRALWVRLMPLLDVALALPAHARPGWLAALEADDMTRAALRELLDDRERLERGGFLQRGPVLAASPGAEALYPGLRVGAYQLLKPLGQGGMSEVWLAERHDGQPRRQVALKIPHAGPGQAALAERLRREQHILAALEHRNIARLYDMGVTAQGLPFLVLEYVEGETLTAYCNSRCLGVAQRLALFLQVLRAVQHAHGMLVLHRDLKPSNILVNVAGDVKLLDFGIAKLLDGEQAEATALTRHSGRALTPDYAAPEQIAGSPLGTACDVYSLGVVLFELLTGERPYHLPRGTTAALEEAILSAEPRRPSETWSQDAPAAAFGSTAPRLRRALRGDLDLIVLTALQKQPERRYASAEAFAQDLQRHFARQPVLARPDSRWYRLRKFLARNSLAVGASTAVLAALGVGTGMVVWQARQTQVEAAKALAIKDFLVGLFESNSIEQHDALRKRQQSVQQLLEQSAEALQAGLVEQPQVRTELQGVVGQLLHDLALNDSAVRLRRQRVELLERSEPGSGQHLQAMRDLAESLAQQGNEDAAGQVLQQAMQRCRSLGAEPPLACPMAQVAFGLRAARLHDLTTAQAHIEAPARAVLRRAPNSAEAAEALAALGELYGTQNRPDEAYPLYVQAMKVREALWGPQSARLARERFQVANNLMAERRLAQAESEYRAALQAFRAALGPEHVTTAQVELQLGRLLLWVRGGGQEEVRHASTVFEQHAAEVPTDQLFDARMVVAETRLLDGRIGEAGSAMEKALATPHSDGESANAAINMHAWYLQSAGRYAEARAQLQALRNAQEQALGPDHPYVADAEDRLARVDLAEGRLDAAEAAFERALHSRDAREEAFGSIKHEATAGRAVVDMERGRFESAWPVVSAQYAAAQQTPRDNQYRSAVIRAESQMARVLAGLGRPAEARPHFERAIEALAQGYAYNPELAVARARYAECLVALGEVARASQQLQQAQAALRMEPQAAPHFRRAVAQAAARLASSRAVAAR